MASITFTVRMTDGTIMEKQATVLDSDVARLINWGKHAFPKGDVMTPSEVVSYWITSCVNEAFDNIYGFERNVAASEAADNVVRINVNIT